MQSDRDKDIKVMLLAACRRFAMVRISDNGPVGQPYHKNNATYAT